MRFLAIQPMIGHVINWVNGNQVLPFVTSGVRNTVPTIAGSSVGRTAAGFIIDFVLRSFTRIKTHRCLLHH